MSSEQLHEAQARVEAAGLSDQISLLFCDYRHVVGRFGHAAFDAVVSCEMIEAVGHEHLPTYFGTVGQCLKAGGKFAMQVCFGKFVLRLHSNHNASALTRSSLPTLMLVVDDEHHCHANGIVSSCFARHG